MGKSCWQLGFLFWNLVVTLMLGSENKPKSEHTGKALTGGRGYFKDRRNNTDRERSGWPLN